MTTTVYRTCPLCEATCGLAIEVEDGRVRRIRGDRDDVFSHGFICPKGSTLQHLHNDPDRLRTPLVKRGGMLQEATWDEAFAAIADRLPPILDEYGRSSAAVYLGNPNVHNMSGVIYNRVLIKTLGSKNVFTASTIDQMPKHVSSGLLFGHPDLIPVPDLDRTDHLLMLGANPLVSNGSLATAPDWPGRLEKIRERGGKVVVVDPRRTKTARAADEHLYIRPGTDALWLFAVVNVLFEHGLVAPGRVGGFLSGLDDVAGATAGFTPERVAEVTGIDPETTRRIAAEFAHAGRAAVYGRFGTQTTEYGTLAAWLVDVLNILTGNLDEPGGAMFARSATERPRSRRGFRTGRWASRVKGLPEVRGELPVATLADEILTEGDGQVRALVTVGGNPVLSAPDAGRLDHALGTLAFMVSVDLYRNETTRHADVILPAPSPLNRAHYDFAFTGLSVRNVANYSPAVFPLPEGMPDEWEILLRLAAIVGGMPADIDIGPLDDMVLATVTEAAVSNEASPIFGADSAQIVATTEGTGPERVLDVLLRTGPYGDGFGADPEGLSLEVLRRHPHGVDLGPLEPRLPDALCTPDSRIDLAPEAIMADIPRLEQRLGQPDSRMRLIGRRELRSNNSWMHNLDVLVRGKERCTLLVHPSDATRLDLSDGGRAVVTSDVGSIEVPVEYTSDIMPGVVSLPHGWGHDVDGVGLDVATRRPGVNSNLVSMPVVDPLSGNAALSGVPVEIRPA